MAKKSPAVSRERSSGEVIASAPVAEVAVAAPLLAPTDAAEFRRVRVEGELIQVPATRRIVRMRTVRPRYLLTLGDIPEPLRELTIKVLYGTISQEQYAEFFEIEERVEHALDLDESMRVVVTAALIYPRVVEEPQAADEIHWDDLDRAEKKWIFDLALLEATRLSLFRLEQESDVGNLEEGEGDTLPTV